MNPWRREEIQRVAQEVRQAAAVDGKDWAREILRQHERGEPVLPVRLRFAHEALGMPLPRGVK